MRTRTTVELERDKLKKQLEKLENELEKKSFLTIPQQVAEELHGLLCHQNHTEGCSWGYEKWCDVGKKDYGAKMSYLEMAKRALLVTDAETIYGIIKAIKEK
jgi:hypothetical protein